MTTMTNDETYNGYANRETWAFNLHWQNNQGLYNETLEEARRIIRDEIPAEELTAISDSAVGELVVQYWRDQIFDYPETDGSRYEVREPLRMMRNEVGSWWRIDYREVGAAVRESLDDES